jgi:autotransporter-associated beta strand protein
MLAGGAAALVQLSAVPALAACSTSTVGTTTTLDCSANTTTINTINNNPNNPATISQRQQLNDNFVVKIGSGTTVSGFGLSIEPTGSNRTVAVTNQGTVSTSQFDGVALNVSGNGGLVSYAGGGAVSGSFNGGGINGTGLNLTNTGSGDIQIGTTASPITAAFAGRVPISAFASGGNVSLSLSGGSLTTSLIGVSLRNGSESSSINAVLTGNTTIVQAPGTSDAIGIRVFFSGPVSIASDANMGTASKPLGQGISVNSDSTINIHQTGGTIYTDTRGIFNNTGIFASSDIATVTMDSNSRIVAYNGVIVSSSSLTTVNVAGAIDSTGPAVVAVAGNGTASVNVSGTLTGDVGVQFFSSKAETVVNTGTITANSGIVSSAGPISVSNSGTIKGTAALGVGIDAVDDMKVTNNAGGKISGTAEGIYSRSASVLVTNSGSITAGQAGLSVAVAGLRGATVTNNAGATISGGSAGVAGLLGFATVVNSGTITATGTNGIGVYAGTVATVTNNAAGVITGKVGIYTSAGASTVINAGTIAGSINGIQFSGSGNTLTLMPGSVISGTVVGAGSDTLQLGGTSSAVFDVSTLGAAAQYRRFSKFNILDGANWTLSGASTYTGATNVNAGTLSVNGSIASSSLTTVNAGGTLGGNGTVGNTTVNGGTLAPGNSIGALTVQGNLVFTAAASYMVEVSPANADRTNVTGTATLGGATVKASFAAGSYINKQYTILNATGGVSGTFNTLANTDLPANFKSSLSYDSNNAYLNLALNFVPPPSGLNANQQSAANAIVGFFNTNGTIPLVFGGLTPAGLTQISGGVATGTQQATFNAMGLFIGLLTDPFIAGRGNPVTSSSTAPQFADDESTNAYASNGKPRSKSERDAYAAVYRKAPVMADPFTQRWSVWAAGYGGSQTTDGNAVPGTNDTRSSIGGVAVGADYRFSPYTIAGFALASGATNFSVNGLGSGRSDLFQAGAFVRHNVGAAYLTGALAYGWQDITTDRTVTIAGTDLLRARFNANAFSGRVEGGYRFVTPWMAMGLTPYAAGQFVTFDLPAYAEQAIAGANTFALTYASKSVTDTRSELGIRTDKSFAMQNGIFTLRGRAAWAHDFNTDRSITPTFQTLPGASFVVNGAAQARDAALVTASAEMKWLNGFSLAGTFEGEFSGVTTSYAGKGVVRYAW